MSISIPKNWKTDEWYGFTRHHFTFQGHPAWIVEPHFPCPDNRWSWCMQWAEAFVPRVGTLALLEHGFYHAHIDLFETRANQKGVTIMAAFQKKLVSMGLSPKVNLIGMSWGGFFSLRYAVTYPENICAIYLDAPLCNATSLEEVGADDRIKTLTKLFNISEEELKTSKLNPVNNVKPLIDAKIPIFAAVGEDDMVLNINMHFNLLEKNFIKQGGKFTNVVRRSAWGHHPHGFDDTTELLKFHWMARE